MQIFSNVPLQIVEQKYINFITIYLFNPWADNTDIIN